MQCQTLAGAPMLEKSAEASAGPRTSLFRERAAMILGMNPRVLRERMMWNVYLWKQKQHWSVVLQPKDATRDVRISDDFIRHNSDEEFQTTVPANKLFLVYELLLATTDPYLMLSVKPDFCPERQLVLHCGFVGPMAFEELSLAALQVFHCYKGYSIVGCNCQHFAADFIYTLGVPEAIATEDAQYVDVAAQGAAVVSAAGASLGLAAVTGAAGASVAMSAMVPLLAGVAAGAGSAGVLGGLCCLVLGAGYRELYNGLRHEPAVDGVEEGMSVPGCNSDCNVSNERAAQAEAQGVCEAAASRS